MPASIDRTRRKRDAVWGVVLFALLQMLCAVSFGALCLIPGLPRWLFVLFVVLAAFCAVLIVPALIVLKQRFQEIEGGEYDAAAEY